MYHIIFQSVCLLVIFIWQSFRKCIIYVHVLNKIIQSRFWEPCYIITTFSCQWAILVLYWSVYLIPYLLPITHDAFPKFCGKSRKVAVVFKAVFSSESYLGIWVYKYIVFIRTLIEGWRRKRSKCFFTSIHLDLFHFHPSF